MTTYGSESSSSVSSISNNPSQYQHRPSDENVGFKRYRDVDINRDRGGDRDVIQHKDRRRHSQPHRSSHYQSSNLPPITTPSYVPLIHYTSPIGFPLHFYPIMIPQNLLPTEESIASAGADIGVKDIKNGKVIRTYIKPRGEIATKDIDLKLQMNDDMNDNDNADDNDNDKKESSHRVSQAEQLAAIEKYRSVLTSTEDTRQIASLSADTPSKVIHFRNVTSEIGMQELVDLCQQFGNVSKCLMLRSKNQALVQYENINGAIRYINHYITTSSFAMIGHRKVYGKYSNHTDLTQSSTFSNNSVIMCTLKMPYDPETQGYLITAEFIYTIFSLYGTIEKIVVMRKVDYQVLIQYSTAHQAAVAHDHMKDQTIYVGIEPTPLDIHTVVIYSHVEALKVARQGAKTRDYTDSPNMNLSLYINTDPNGVPIFPKASPSNEPSQQRSSSSPRSPQRSRDHSADRMDG